MKHLLPLLLFSLTTTAYSQCYNCGMFGMLSDVHEDVYVARFTAELDSIQLESARTCEMMTCPVSVLSVRARKRNTILEIMIEHPKFDDVPYRIKYPSGSWGLVADIPGHW